MYEWKFKTIIYFFISHIIRMLKLNLSLKELKLIAKIRGIKCYKSISNEKLLSALDELESAGSGNNLDNVRIKKIREDFNELKNKFLKPKIKEIRRNLYEIENKKILSKSKMKEIEPNLIKLEEIHFKVNRYYDYEDIECKGIRDAANLFNQSTDEDYYKPIKTNSAFNGNYIEYQNKGDKDKNLSIKEYLYMIITNLRDITNYYKAHRKLKVHFSHDYETEGEWKIWLSMKINFVSSKDSDEICIMYTKGNNIDILMGSETNDVIK